MPRRVVPIWKLPSLVSPAWSSSRWYGMIRCALAEMRRPLMSTPRREARSTSSVSTLRVHHHAVADQRRACPGRGSPTGSGGSVNFLAAHDRVAGVVAALEADDEVGLLGEQVRRPSPCLRRPTGRRRSLVRASQFESRRAASYGADAIRRSGPMIGRAGPQISSRRDTVRTPICSRSPSRPRLLVTTIERSSCQRSLTSE